MTDEELKKLWRDAPQQVIIEPGIGNTLSREMETTLQKFDRTLRMRDMRETIVMVILMPVFAYVAYKVEPVLSKIGAAMIIPSCLLAIYVLKRVKTYRVTDATLPFYDYLKQYRHYIALEKKLLDNVLWWYILPSTCSLILFFAGLGSLMNIGFTVIVAGGIFVINKYAVKHYFNPLLHKLDAEIMASEEG